MDKYAILLGYFDKQLLLVNKLYKEIYNVDVSVYDKRFLFALKTQQFYTAIEDLFKQIAKAFENHLDDLSSYHKELLVRMSTQIPNIRPEAISNKSFLLLDKLRGFRHFVRHAYDCELDEEELLNIQNKLQNQFPEVLSDLARFRKYIEELAK